jgi:hypothetical protein
MTSGTGKRCSDKGFFEMGEQAYLELLDWTARQGWKIKCAQLDGHY